MTQQEYDEICRKMDEDFKKVNEGAEVLESPAYFLAHYQVPEGMTYEAAFYTYMGFINELDGDEYYTAGKEVYKDGTRFFYNLLTHKHKGVPAEVFEFEEN